MLPDVDMGAFWDERARENAAYFVENRLDYYKPDLHEFWATGEQVVDQVCALLDLRMDRSDEVVEIGCGIGRLTRVLASRVSSVRALDVSEEMLKRAREHNDGLAKVDWMLGDGRGLTGVKDGSADGVFSHVVFQHIPDPEITYGYVREMGRVLRPGGWAAFQVSDQPAVHVARPGGWRALKAWLGRGPKGVSHAAWRGSAVDLASLENAAEAADLEVGQITGRGTQFCLVLLRRRAYRVDA